jgi:signal transduction histidine kinase
MTDTNERLTGVTEAMGAGALGMEGTADIQRTTDFQAILLTIAGHDLRQPLQIIQSAHDRLGIGIRTKSEQDLLQMGQIAIDNLSGQLDQLLDALRLFEHSKKAKLSPVKLQPLFQQACYENEERASQKGIAVRVCPTSASVMSNSLILSGILRNLVGNAIEYTQPNGRILVGCRRLRQNVRIDICDTGIGIADEQLLRIFEAFTRLDSTRHDGLGVGLFIVRRAIGVLGHRVNVKSAASRGSRFSIIAARAE